MAVKETKVCKYCSEEKPRSAFRRIPGHKNAVRQNCLDCEKFVARKYNAANPEALALRNRKSKLKRAFGLTLEQYQEMLHAQDQRCALCGTDVPGGRGSFVVDHCHTHGNIRGLLCNLCNVGLGALRDSPDLLRRAAEYVERSIP